MFLTKPVRQILSYFLFHNFYSLRNSALKIFILLCVNVKSRPIPEILRCGHTGIGRF